MREMNAPLATMSNVAVARTAGSYGRESSTIRGR